jgi:hypothetical protein
MRPLHEKPCVLRYYFADFTASWFYSMFRLSTAIAREFSKAENLPAPTKSFVGASRCQVLQKQSIGRYSSETAAMTTQACKAA